MGDSYPRYKVAAVHAAPVYLDREASVEKACGLIAEAARKGAALVAFSEGYLPGYPLWAVVNRPYEIHDLYTRLYSNALTLDGPEVRQLCRAARQQGVYVSIGINEKCIQSPGTLWASNLLIGPEGRVLVRHQKMVPTYAERLVWSNGDATGLVVCHTELGGIGALICGENTNTLARFALLAQGEQLHISSYPPAYPFKAPGAKAEYDPLRANQIRSGAHAFEGKLYNVVACAFCDERTMELSSLSDKAREVLEKTPKPASMVLGPAGNVIAGPVAGDREEILLADIDLEACIVEKQLHDITGGYNRFDVFNLRIRRNPLKSIELIDGGSPAGEFQDIEARC
jgi:nitrilase